MPRETFLFIEGSYAGVSVPVSFKGYIAIVDYPFVPHGEVVNAFGQTFAVVAPSLRQIKFDGKADLSFLLKLKDREDARLSSFSYVLKQDNSGTGLYYVYQGSGSAETDCIVIYFSSETDLQEAWKDTKAEAF